jgi:hypothetical protein
MGRSSCTFKKRDVKTALAAVRESGVEVARVEIGADGKIVIVTGKPVTAASDRKNPWDEVLEHERH